MAARNEQDLLGRRAERDALDHVVSRIREGSSASLVVHGEAGVGKSALLRYAAGHAETCRVTRCAGVESEMELAYSGLHQLCMPFVDLLDRLPDPQHDALGVLFGLRPGGSPDPLLVRLAVLTLFAGAAETRPLLCLVDDVQWLDEASVQVLAFVARRLAADPVGIVLAARDGVGRTPDLFGDIPHIAVRGLADADARALLESAVPGPLDPQVRDRIVAETRGNPLALLELPQSLTPSELVYGFGNGRTGSLTGRMEQGFLARHQALTSESRQLVLLAAADPSGDVGLLWRAAGIAGVGAAVAPEVQQSGLLDLATQVRFRHPLVRSAVYQGSTAAERQKAHEILAGATNAQADPDRRAWHRAHATHALDEAVAAELSTSADRARVRGGLLATAAFLRRATELTPDENRRAQRALVAAEAGAQAGDLDGALALVGMAEAGPLTELEGARAQLLRAQIAFTATRGHRAPSLLLAAARRLEGIDATLAKETYLEAFAAAIFAGRLAVEADAKEVATAVLSATWGEGSRPVPQGCDLLLQGLARLITDGYGAGAPMLRQALAMVQTQRLTEDDSLRWLWLAARIARSLGDDAAWDQLTHQQVDLARSAGARSVLPVALTERFSVELFTGHLAAALAAAAETEAVVAATGAELSPHIAHLLAAWRGDEATAKALREANGDEVRERGEGLWLVGTDWTAAVYYNSLGRYGDALVAAERAAEFSDDLGLSVWVLPELIEAAVRSGAPARATRAIAELEIAATACGTDWLRGVAVRSQALLRTGREAEELYQGALQLLQRTRIRVAVARGHLLYGEWLRRERRRRDARQELSTAHDIFVELGMAGFAERSRSEFAATGAVLRRRSTDALSELTPQEAHIAGLAALGRSNPEIGAQLLLSPRTVEWHLRKVFEKLGITSRRALEDALDHRRGSMAV